MVSTVTVTGTYLSQFLTLLVYAFLSFTQGRLAGGLVLAERGAEDPRPRPVEEGPRRWVALPSLFLRDFAARTSFFAAISRRGRVSLFNRRAAWVV